MRFKTFIIFILIVVAFAAGIYYRDDAVRFYNNLTKQIQNFQKTEVGSTISEITKEVFAPMPLKVGGIEKPVVLLKFKVIAETNIQRQNNGLALLLENEKLSAAALAKAQDMFKNQYFEHESPSGIKPGELVSQFGYKYILAGENLILGNFSDEKEVVQKWMDSPGHRANILNNRYTEIGVAIIKGVFNGENVWIGVQEFGLPLSVCPQPDAALKDQIDFNKTQLDELSLLIDEKREQIENTNPRLAAYRQMVNDYNQLVVRYNSLAEQVKLEILQYNTQVNIFNSCVQGQ